jgi:putative transposase
MLKSTRQKDLSMARPLRIEYEGAWYHVMNRGAGGRCIFPDNALRKKFLSLLCDLHEMYGVCCHAYCLMGNHYHLLVQTPRANLGRAMRHLDGVYAQAHNHHLRTDGPLFRGRYKGQLIERDSYLLRVSRYVHRNPLAAGLCDQLTAYPWSSYPYFAGLHPAPSWLPLHETMGSFGSTDAYCAFVAQAEDGRECDELSELLTGELVPPVLGTPNFIETIQQQFYGMPDYEIPEAKLRAASVTLDEIIELVSVHIVIPRKDFMTPAHRDTRAVRAIAMLLCRQSGGFSLRTIANAFGIERYTTVASAIGRCRDKAVYDTDLARVLAILKSRIRKMRNA